MVELEALDVDEEVNPAVTLVLELELTPELETEMVVVLLEDTDVER